MNLHLLYRTNLVHNMNIYEHKHKFHIISHSQFLFTVLDEESESANEQVDKRHEKPEASFSQASWIIGNLDFLEGIVFIKQYSTSAKICS